MAVGAHAPRPRMLHTRVVDNEAADLRQRLAEVDERIDRIGKRFTAGYGTDADRAGWLAWLRELEARRAAIIEAISEAEQTPGNGEA